jgi:hypothetical protein
MRRNLNNFTPGQTAVMFGLRAHTDVNDNEVVESEDQPFVTYSEIIQKPPARHKISWRGAAALRWRFVPK